MPSNYQAVFNGVTMGAGTNIGITNIDGLDDLPDILDNDVQRTTSDGAFPALDILKPRVVTIDLLVIDSGAGDFASTFETVKNATINQPGTNLLPLSVLIPGWSAARRINCRPRRRHAPISPEWQWGYGAMTIEFYAEDPRVYADTATTSSTAASVSVNNTGTYPTPCSIVTAGATTPTITGPNSGSLQFSGSGPYTIDTGALTVTGGGGYADLVQPATWFLLPPGSSTVATTSGTVTVTWRSAWV